MESGLMISREFAVDTPAARTRFETRRRDNLLKFPVPETAKFVSRDEIFAAGEAATEFFQIVEGVVMVLRHLPGGRRQILDIAGRGRFIGLTAGGDHDCTAVALRETMVFRHPRYGAQAPTLSNAADLPKIMCEEIHRLRDLATSLGRKTAVERLAGFLVAMIDDGADDGPVSMILPVSRQEIADHLGLVIETVCRNLTALKRRGFIRVDGNFGMTVDDPEALRLIAAGFSMEDQACDKKVSRRSS